MKILPLLLVAVALPLCAQESAPNRYKGCHQLTKFDSISVTVEESGLSHVVEHKRIDMLDREGCRANSVVTVDYDPLSAYVEIQRVLVHRMAEPVVDTIVWEGRGTVYDYVAPARLIYWGASQKMAEIGHLDPGDEIEIWTYRKGFTYALLGEPNGLANDAGMGVSDKEAATTSVAGMGTSDKGATADDDSRYIPPMRGHFYDIVPFWSEQPVRLKVYRVSIPTSKNLRWEVYNAPKPTSEKDTLVEDMFGIKEIVHQVHYASQFTHSEEVQGERTIYTFACNDIMPLRKEPNTLASNDIECKLLLSTAPDWQSKSRWFYGVNEDYGSFVTTPEVTAKVKELLAPAKSELDSISILTHWVADNIRYCGISMGEGEGYTLHNAEMNFTDRCGVCKDKAGMLITMLRAAGFKAYAAMTMAHERIDPIPADQFNHSVCVVERRDGRLELLDPTWVPNLRELWSSAEQQQGYLMGLPQGADLQYTPVSPAENHYLRINAASRIKRNGDLVGSLEITAEGQSDKAVRGVFSCRTSEWYRNLERELLMIDPRAVIESVYCTDNDDYLEQPVTITYYYTIPHYATVSKEEIIFIPFSARNLFSRAQGQLRVDVSAEQRTQPFADNCSRLVEINESIQLPYKYSHLIFEQEIPGVVHPAVNFGCGIQLKEKTLLFSECLMFNKRLYDAADYPAFRATVLNQKTLATTPVILVK